MAESTLASPISNLVGKRIALGVSGSIAAYKAADLASKLVQHGAVVDVLMTQSATRLVGPDTFAALTQRPVRSGFERWSEDFTGHVSLARDADSMIVAPATASTIARLAQGLADDIISATALSVACPLLVAPAMEHHMWRHPATQSNISTLQTRGAIIVGPDSGRLASGAAGDGRLAAIDDLIGALRLALGRAGPLAGKRVVVTAGGTREPLDPVRFFGNRSSALMGYGLAQAALDAGAVVTLITTRPEMRPPNGAEVIAVETALDMRNVVSSLAPRMDVLIMAAAVADFRPDAASDRKIKKRAAGNALTVHLAPNPDILAEVETPGAVRIGFAAETDQLVEHAQSKLHAKRLDLIVANDAIATIAKESVEPTLIFSDGRVEPLPRMSKLAFGQRLISEVGALLSHRQ